MPFLTAAWAALKSIKISAAVLIYAGLILSGVVGAEVFERTFRFNLLFIHIEGLGAQLADLKAKDAAALKAAQAHFQAVATAQTAANAKLDAAYAAKLAAITATYQPALKEVSTYVTAKDDADCVINVGAQRLFDTGMSGSQSLASSAGGNNEAPSDLDLSGVVSADVLNHQAFDQTVAEAQAWRDWYAAQSAAWSAPGIAAAPSTTTGDQP